MFDPLSAFEAAWDAPLSVDSIFTCIGGLMIAGYIGRGAAWLFVQACRLVPDPEPEKPKTENERARETFLRIKAERERTRK
jgi:hypothetical protein